MKNLIETLSLEAQEFLRQYDKCNIGILSNASEYPVSLNKWKVCDIALFEKSTVFIPVAPGTGVDSYIKSQPVPVKSFSVFVCGVTDDSGFLLGLLKKHAAGGFLYKSYLDSEFGNFCFIKYNYKNLVTKLIEPYSFSKGGGRKL